MRIFHISDLHIGKQLHYYNMKDSQIEALTRIANSADEYRPDVIIIAGDIYDKSAPSGEAYELFDEFLNHLADITPSIPVLIIAGNHDSPSRLGYAGNFLKRNSIHISVFPPRDEKEHLECVTLQDEYGEVNFYLLPFTKPGYVKGLFDEGEIVNYDSAVRKIIERENIDYSKRNVLVAHQFFVSGTTKPDKCDSELTYLSLGGIDSVDIECVKDFDYVALGHIHKSQKVVKDNIRYSGTPLKYSVSEEIHTKSITMVELREKGAEVRYDFIPIEVSRDVRTVRGTMQEVIEMANDINRDDYVSITLTDEDIYRPKDRLQEHYNNILEIKLDNARTRAVLSEKNEGEESPNPFAAFEEFYQAMNGQPLSDAEEQIMREIIHQAEESME